MNFDELIEEILSGKDLHRAKIEFSRKYRISIPKNSEILKHAGGRREILREILRKRPVRTSSGVCVVAIMSSPERCPHGKCVPCPGGPDSPFNSPQSYVGHEPAALRAIQNNYDPYEQVRSRLTQLSEIGHHVDKCELIIMGGTFTARDENYQRWFVKEALHAMNDFPGERTPEKTLEEEKKLNERAKVRNVGITFETRPDCVDERRIDLMLELGGTKVEIGVQSIYDDVLERIKRGHGVKEVVEANRILRDSGFKVGFHMMPGLPGSDRERDLRMFREIFSDERFKPDFLKIYPTLVVKGTELYEMWRRGEYEPLTTEEAAELIAEIKRELPEWVRLQRVQRDIPVHKIEAGIKKSNLRELAREIMRRRGWRCRCIRCREAGHSSKDISKLEFEMVERRYRCCGGDEFFISFESEEVLAGYIRLRFPNRPHRKELQNSSIVRELHIYGPLVPFGRRGTENVCQHRGFGERLLRRAEEISKEAGFERIAVISGIGVREYYRKRGYELEGPYMVKEL